MYCTIRINYISLAQPWRCTVKLTRLLWVVAFCLLSPITFWAQQSESGLSSSASAYQPASTNVPKLIKFSGVVKDLTGKPLTGPVEITFAIYKEQGEGLPIWQETQVLQLDEQGRYSVLLGAMQPEGLPMELFTTGEARWLEVQVVGAEPQPRTLLVSVPYALKAADAETLGGKPASAYLLASEATTGLGVEATAQGSAGTGETSKTGTKPKGRTSGDKNASAAAAPAANYIPVFTDNSGTLGSSVMYQNGSNLGIGTTAAPSPLSVTSDSAPLPTVLGLPTLAKFGSPSGTVPWALKQNANASATPTLMWFETADGNLGAIGAGGSKIFELGGLSGNALALDADGAAKMFIDTNGNVGIGTKAPPSPLSVTSGSAPLPTVLGLPTLAKFGSPAGTIPWALKQNANASTTPTLMWFETADGNLGAIGAGGSKVFELGGLSGNALALDADGAPKMFISTAGNVGIGTSTPAEKVDVAGNIKASGSLSATSFSGDGAGLTNLTAANISSGTANISITGNAATAVIAASATSATTAGTAANVSCSGCIDSGKIADRSLNTIDLASNSVTGNEIAGASIVDYHLAADANISPSKLAASARTRGITYLAGCDSCAVLGSSDSQRQFFVNAVGAMTINSVTCFSDAGAPAINIARDNGSPTNLLSSNLTCNGTPTTSFTSSALALNDQLDFVMAAPDGVAKRITVVIKAALN
jgi:hypothetical protein